jgi:hypothetical protein
MNSTYAVKRNLICFRLWLPDLSHKVFFCVIKNVWEEHSLSMLRAEVTFVLTMIVVSYLREKNT